MAGPTVTVLDHGAGNLRSVVRALRHVGADASLTSDPDVVRRSDRIVLPGQGAFRDCMTRLKATGLDQVVLEHIQADRPYLGICLGLQVLFDEGREHGGTHGLGVLRGVCHRLPGGDGLKIPHMGWNTVDHDGDAALAAIESGEWYYFVHSFCVVPSESLACATTAHGQPFVSAVGRGALLAVQFHPEKSHRAGLKLLERFIS